MKNTRCSGKPIIPQGTRSWFILDPHYASATTPSG
jgi:hypothetical protein